MCKIYFLFLLFISQIICSQNIIINEVMSSNQKTIKDEERDSPDWIELYNNGTTQINLSGYYLSDDTFNLKKWSFGNATILPGEFLIVFASSKNKKATYWHTNFNISASGEKIFLCNQEGVLIDFVKVPAMQSDISYGRVKEGQSQWVMQSPSPGLKNSGTIFSGVADAIVNEPKGGFYSSVITVNLSAGTSDIFYTLDGKDPDSTSSPYIGPINISKTSVLKAISYKPNFLPGKFIPQTYFINEKTDLPVISLSSDPYNLFDKSFGVYSNYKMDWERPAHIEFFEDNKQPGFSKDCYVSIHGSQSAEWAQKSLNVKFKDAAGPLEYPLFPGFYVTTFKSIVLRNSGNDWQYTHIRDAMMQSLVKDLDIEYQEYRPATSFINGEYWGIYNIRERINADYIGYRHGVNPDSIDLLENNKKVISGDTIHYQKILDYISTANMNTDEAYNFLDKMIDMDECILYFAAQAYYDNMDWPGGNIKFWRKRSATGKWRWILLDLDFGFGLYAHGPSEDHIKFMFSPVETRYSNPPWSTLFQRKLVENSKIRNRFINQIADLLNTNFKSDRVVNTINSIANHISTEITRHRKRWSLNGEGLTKMITFANQRPAYLRTHVRNFFGCGNDGTLTLSSNDGGKIKLNTLTLDNKSMPWTGIYFQGVAINLDAIPSPGYKFIGWSGAVTSSESSLSLNVTASTNLTATFVKDYSYKNGIVINEINYNSSKNFDCGDWIELYNSNSSVVDLSGWTFTDSDRNNQFIIPLGTLLNPDQYLVLVEDQNLFMQRFPNVKNVVGNFNFGLNNAGELIKLVDKAGQIIDSLTFDDQAPWPADADGKGQTLELIFPASDNSNAVNWKASEGNGSPGQINTVYTSVENEEITALPTKFELGQNYPNPFNPETVISYQLPVASYVTLKVYDVLGKEVAILADEFKKPGKYSTLFVLNSSFASGIYFYTLHAGNFSATKKFVLIK